MSRHLWTFALCAVLAAGACAGAETTDRFPNRPVRLMVGFAPGGGVDVTARIVAAALSDYWGASVIVDNRTGASGSIATEITAKANPDGYTILFCQIGSHAITPARFRKLPYDHIRDFAPVSMIGSTPNVFYVHPSMPTHTLPEFIAYAKANPGKVSFGSSGVGASPHLSIELFKTMTGIDIVHVPYKGASQALADVMGGQMQSGVGNLPGGPLAAIKAGRVRALGITSARRNKQVPDLPTFAEAGVPGYDVSSWYGICAPARIPQPVLAQLNADLVKLLGTPELRRRLEDQGIDVTPTTPQQFAAHIAAETAKWTKVVRDAGLVGD